MGMAADAVARRERLADLPDDPAAREEAVRRQASRNTLTVMGLGAGAIVGLQPLLMLGSADGGWVVLMELTMLGGLVGGWWDHRMMLRKAVGLRTRRVAELRPRRLLDYLMPVEVVAQCWSLVVSLYFTAAGLVAISSGREDDRQIGIAITLGAVLALGNSAAAIVVQRRALAAGQPAVSESAYRWEEAERAQGLRDMAMVAILSGLPLVLAAQSLWGELSGGFPTVLLWAAAPLLIGALVTCLLALRAGNRPTAWRNRAEAEEMAS